MPEFCSSLLSAKAGEKLTRNELIRAIRFMGTSINIFLTEIPIVSV